MPYGCKSNSFFLLLGRSVGKELSEVYLQERMVSTYRLIINPRDPEQALPVESSALLFFLPPGEDRLAPR